MPRITQSQDTIIPQDSGAFEMSKNPAVIAGWAAVAGGTCLAAAVGTAVAPAPTLGLMAAGAGLVVAGDFDAYRFRFSAEYKTLKADNPDASMDELIALHLKSSKAKPATAAA